jgi:hypothetical protein
MKLLRFMVGLLWALRLPDRQLRNPSSVLRRLRSVAWGNAVL